MILHDLIEYCMTCHDPPSAWGFSVHVPMTSRSEYLYIVTFVIGPEGSNRPQLNAWQHF